MQHLVTSAQQVLILDIAHVKLLIRGLSIQDCVLFPCYFRTDQVLKVVLIAHDTQLILG